MSALAPSPAPTVPSAPPPQPAAPVPTPPPSETTALPQPPARIAAPASSSSCRLASPPASSSSCPAPTPAAPAPYTSLPDAHSARANGSAALGKPPGNSPVSSPKGQLLVTVLSARHLPGAPQRPYTVVSYDKNEYVGRDSLSSALVSSGHNAKGEPGTPSSASAANPVWNDQVIFDVTSERPKVFVSVYDRHAEDEGFLGMRDIAPVLQDRRTSEHWYPLSTVPLGGLGSAADYGQIRVRMRFERKPRRQLTPKDFEMIKLIGKGTFGRVFQVRKKDSRRIYAMKVLSKREILLKKEVVHTMGERKILEQSLSCPFLIGLKFSFQSPTELFFVTDYKSGGELFWHLQREGRFTEERAKFYTAELVLALEHLHKYDIVYRDLKPENILLDATGHVALCDFGLSKPNLAAGQLTTTFCGTTEFLAPEVLLDESGYSKLVDFWSLGVLLFEMCCGWSPFYAEDTQQMYRNICFGKIKFPRGAIGDDGKQFVKSLLNRNPKHRLGAAHDALDLKLHPFFSNIDFDLLASKKVPPPFKPLVESEDSVANFDPEFTATDLRSVVHEADGVGLAKDAQVGNAHAADEDGILSSSLQRQFSGFSYSGRDDPCTPIGGRSRRSSGFNSPLAFGGGGLLMTRMMTDEPAPLPDRVGPQA